MYTPLSKSLSQFLISDTEKVVVFSSLEMVLINDKKTPTKKNRQPLKIFMSSYLMDFGSSSKGKKKFEPNMHKKYLFKDYNIYGEGLAQLISSFSKWIREALFKQHTKKKANFWFLSA